MGGLVERRCHYQRRRKRRIYRSRQSAADQSPWKVLQSRVEAYRGPFSTKNAVLVPGGKSDSAGSSFASKHAEAIFVTGHDPAVLAPKIANIRKLAAEEGRDPKSIKFFCTFTPIIGRTDEEAQEKLAEVKKYASTVGGKYDVYKEEAPYVEEKAGKKLSSHDAITAWMVAQNKKLL